MTNLYFLKIFFIDKILPYSVMIFSLTSLLLELFGPQHLRHAMYDFSDRLFFKFIYRPIVKFFKFLQNRFLSMCKKLKGFLQFKKKVKEKKAKKKQDKLAIKLKKKEAKLLEKKNKSEARALAKQQSKQEYLQNRIENKRLKAEANHKLKLLIAKKLKKNRNSENNINVKTYKQEYKHRQKLENQKLKSDTKRKLKIFLAYKVKAIINKLQQK